MLSGFLVQPSHSCLASSLIEELLKIPDEDLQQYILVLPTQRLASYVISQLAKIRAAFVPPLVTTMEQLIALEASRRHKLRPATDGTLEFLLSQLLKEGNFEQLRIGHERELRLILGELYDHRVRKTAFSALHQCLAEDIYKNDSHLGSLHRRASEMETILQQLENLLEKRGLAVRSRIFAETIEEIAISWRAQLPFDKSKMIVAGYTSMVPAWHPLLESLCQMDSVIIWLTEQPQIYHATSPIKELTTFIQNFREKTIYPAKANRQGNEPMQILETASPYQECRTIVRLCHDLIKKGQDPSRIAILVTSEADYQKYLRTLVSQYKISCNIALSFPLRDVAIGRWVQLLREVCEKNFQISRLLAWCSHPISIRWWSQFVAEDKRSYSQLAEFLCLQKNCHSWESLLQCTKNGPYAELFQNLQQCIQAIAMSREKSIHRWFAEWTQLTEDFQLTANIEEQYREAIEDAFEKFRYFQEDLLHHGNWLLSPNEFWSLIDQHLLSSDVRSIGEPLSGLQILSLPESRFFPFDTIFLLGCNEGTFPKALPQDELLDDYLKKKMGMPGWEALEAMEDQTFHLLKERIPQLILSRALFRANEPQVRSRFIEKLITEGDVNIIPVPSQGPLLRPKLPAEKAANGPGGASEWYTAKCLEGVLALHPDKLTVSGVSATALEKLQRCPYRFLLDRLGVKDHKPIPHDDDNRIEGEWLHAVLEAFFTGSYQGKTYMGPLHELCKKFDPRLCLDRLIALTHKIGPSNIKLTPLYHQLVQHSWPEFVRHLGRMYQDQWTALAKGQREVAFGGENCLYQASIYLNQSERQLNGRIDSIDFTERLTVITDYKRQTIPDKKQIGIGLSPQLAFYGRALSNQPSIDKDTLLLGYWNVIKGVWVPVAAGNIAKEEAIRRGLLQKSAKIFDMDELQAATEKLWLWRERDILESQRFYADPTDCGLCDYENVCRRNDSSQNQRIVEQSYLNSRYLKKETP